MQSTTNDMELKNANDLQTLDLSCRSEQETNLESGAELQNYPALDLSCKNSVTSITAKGTNTRIPLPYSLRSSLAHTNRQDQHSNLSDMEKQSPFTSTIILSSSSESNSPKERTESKPSFYNTGSNITNNIPMVVPSPSVTIGVPFLPLHPYLNSEPIKIPVATTITSTITPTPSTETPSLQTNRSIRKYSLECINEPSSQGEMSTPSLEAIKKTPRPFKAYSKNPFPALKRQIDTAFTYNSNEYFEFREKMLTYKKLNESTPNPKMRRTSKTEHPGLPTSTAEEKDAAYWERRKKNNEAAKRSRDARRAKEDELAIWATYLEKENTLLKSELKGLYCLLQQLGYDINQINRYKLW